MDEELERVDEELERVVDEELERVDELEREWMRSWRGG